MEPQHRSDIERIYRDHGHSVLRRARQILGSEEDAKEVLHELFTSLLANPKQFDGRSSITTWLYSATTHLCLNRIKRYKTRARLLETQVKPAQHEAAEPRSHDLVEAHRLLAEMPHDLGVATAYYYFDEMTQDEIAEVMGCSRRHVGHLIERAQQWAQAQETVT